MYYLQSRYYDANIGRFINSDEAKQITNDEDSSILQFGLFIYCENNPISYQDYDGFDRKKSVTKKRLTYVFKYVNGNGVGFQKQVNKSAYFSTKDKNVKVKKVTTVSDFIKAWNSMPSSVDKIYLYLHGEKDRLCFWKADLFLQRPKNLVGPCQDFSALKKVNVKKFVALFSCHGYVKNKVSAAYCFYQKTHAPTIYACDGGVSYTRFNNIRARHSYSLSKDKRGWFYSIGFNSYFKYGTITQVYGVLWI